VLNLFEIVQIVTDVVEALHEPSSFYYRYVLGADLWVIHQGKVLSPVSLYRAACHRYIPRCSRLCKRRESSPLA